MAYPFGQTPTLHEYLAWCSGKGCTMQSGLYKEGNIFATRHILKAPDGKHVVIADVAMTERLLPRFVAYLDRRLGLDSPFPKLGNGLDN